MERSQLLQNINKFLFDIEDVEFAYIYGSYALNLETPVSDIDIAIFQKTKKSKYDFRMKEFEVEGKLVHNFPNNKFEIRSFNDAPTIIVGKILTEGKLLFFKNENFYYDYLTLNWAKYMDYCLIYNPLFNERYNDMLNDR